jgi:hypothetical protein
VLSIPMQLSLLNGWMDSSLIRICDTRVSALRVAVNEIKTYPTTYAEPQLSVIALALSVLAFDVPHPQGNAGEVLSHSLHVGLVRVSVDVHPLESGNHLFASSVLHVTEVVKSRQCLGEID